MVNLAGLSSNLRELLYKDVQLRTLNKENEKLKLLIKETSVLRQYDSRRQTKLSVDASKANFVAVILKHLDQNSTPQTYMSGMLTGIKMIKSRRCFSHRCWR